LQDKLLADLLAELDQLADEVVEEWLSPEECCQQLAAIIGSYQNQPLSETARRCLDDVISLRETVELESSTPDVVQEYLFYLVDHFAKLARTRRPEDFGRF